MLALSCIILICLVQAKKDGEYYEIELKSVQTKDAEVKSKDATTPSAVEQVAEWLEKVKDREVVEKFDEDDFKLLVANLDEDTLNEIRSDTGHLKNTSKLLRRMSG